ncbi:uncharacterized protein LOC113238631 [Hyposmocoma kahamanoa]|uniref:uncharacterized protein LOC113238631 n=1 Tax=Hyposmocoma kahamanoa TaxID=1477025 RepID=UPI000E6D5E5B|nr:uncharacterized protein LOC113238631 [Hyposmocoma kahamanoa]
MARLLVYLTLAALTSSALPEATPPAPAPAGGAAPPAAEARADELPAASGEDAEDPPEGYYAFVESPNATPPRVRPPPYRQVAAECPEAADPRPHVTAHNLCGDLNLGVIPRNPMGQSPAGEPYPFELIRNQTLRFLSRTLPVLRADDTLPRVAQLAAPPRAGDSFCMLYRAINGDSSSAGGVERREDPGPAPHPHSPHTHHPRYEGPPTPCPARVEYATPVFARNYQGVWRYVVQIPYEGYFTQTVEVTRCMQSRCHYLEGGCLSSPRWVSLLVAELHYPQEYQQTQYLQRRAGVASSEEAAAATDKPPHCDGHDELGCYQVRLYYDWFLVPGSCKCWRPDYFARYVRRRHSTNEL